MELVLDILYAIIDSIAWYFTGLVAIGLFSATWEPSTIPAEKWRKRRWKLLFVALLGPLLLIAFLVYVAYILSVITIFDRDRKFIIIAFFDWMLLGFKDPFEEMPRRKEFDMAKEDPSYPTVSP